jgi:hypothetical protein
MQQAHERLKLATDEMLKRLIRFEPATFPLEDKGWNPSEVIQHLTISEKGILGYVKKKTSSGWIGLEEATEETAYRGKVLLERLASAEKYAAPDFIAKPEKGIALNDAIAAWIGHRKELIQYFDTAPAESLNSLVFRQPAAGMLTLIQTVNFIASHIEHHYQQIDTYAA